MKTFRITDFEVNGPYEYAYNRPNVDYTGVILDSKGKPLVKVIYKAIEQHRTNTVNWLRNKFKTDRKEFTLKS